MKKLSGEKDEEGGGGKALLTSPLFPRKKRKEFDDVLMQKKKTFFFGGNIWFGKARAFMTLLGIHLPPHPNPSLLPHPILKTHPAPLRKAPPKKMRGAIASFWRGGEGGEGGSLRCHSKRGGGGRGLSTSWSISTPPLHSPPSQAIPLPLFVQHTKLHKQHLDHGSLSLFPALYSLFGGQCECALIPFRLIWSFALLTHVFYLLYH